MKIGTSPVGYVFVVALVVGLLFGNGCTNTPEGLSKWENRPGSEELFIKRLQDPRTSDDTRARALELLVKQWRYSSDMVRKGVVSDISEEDGRERIVAQALPKIQEIYQSDDEAVRVSTRDALYTLRRQVTSQENKDAIDASLLEWLKKDWSDEPCKEIGGVRAAGIFNQIGPEDSEAIIANLLNEGDWEKTYCALNNTDQVEWRGDSEEIADAMLSFWERDLVPEDMDNRVIFLDNLFTFAKLPNVRKWAFTKLRDEKIDTNDRGLIVAILARSNVEEDYEKYKEMLDNTDIYRWEAVRAMTKIKGADGLKDALDNLPDDSSAGYGHWDGALRRNGHQQAASNICAASQLKDIRKHVLPVLVDQAQNQENVFARSLAIHCIGALGTQEHLDTLAALKSSQTNAIKVPYWSLEGDPNDGTVPLTEIIDQARTNLSAALEAKNKKDADDADDAEQNTEEAN